MRTLLIAAAIALIALGGPAGPQPAAAHALVGADARVPAAPPSEIDRILEAAVAAARDVPHSGQLLVASFGEGGPQVTEVQVTRGVDGGLSVVREDGWEVGRVGQEGFLRSSGSLLRLGGIERAPVDLERLWSKYQASLGGTERLDTGHARSLRLLDRETGEVREVLYLDAETDLVVRRETFAPDGRPLRVVAFTSLEVADAKVVAPEAEGLEVEAFSLNPVDLERLERDGFVAPARLPAGYELVGGFERPEASVPTLHLVYSDGLYTLSIFEQLGRLSPRALEGATSLRSADGGAVWRWPGSEPRRVVWGGEGITFTAITDAPVDEVLTVVTGLPNDPAPSILGRLSRGMARVGRWLWPLDGSDS